MSRVAQGVTQAQLELLGWIASLGAVTAPALALRSQISVPAAYKRLLVLRGRELLRSAQPLVGQPVLFLSTRKGLRACRAHGIEPARASASEAAHLIACARVAALLERLYPEHRSIGERELRHEEREHGRAIASATLRRTTMGRARLHRPDLVLMPTDSDERPPLAVEVELSVKAPARLQAICLAWARCQDVGGVLYVVAPGVERPLRRALAVTAAHERIAIMGLEALEAQVGLRRTVAADV
jgi:hypothetical protein